MEHRLVFNDKEADLLAEVLSHSLRGIPMTFTPVNRAYLIHLKKRLEERKSGRLPQTTMVEEAPITRLEEEPVPDVCPICRRSNGEHDLICPNHPSRQPEEGEAVRR